MSKILINNKDINKLFNTEINSLNFSGCSLDSRNIKKNNIFFAYKGKKNDGNKFIAQAKNNGAILAFVEKKNPRVKIFQIVVKNTHLALIKLAKHARLKSVANIIAITGSVGKTSTKDALTHTLNQDDNIFSAQKSFNNIFGVPLEILNMPKNTKIAIFEIGMNHSGEITRLIKILRPHIGVVLNVSYVHGGNFDNEKQIADGKAEIINKDYPLQTLILNKDNKYYNKLKNKANKNKIINILTYSKQTKANFTLSKLSLNKTKYLVEVKFQNSKKINYTVNSINDYLVGNSMAILACLKATGVNITRIKKLSSLMLTEGRGNIITTKLLDKNIQIHNHSYNSSPASMVASLEIFLNISKKQKLIIVGDMNELGSKTNYYHLKLLKLLKQNKNNIYLLVGKILYKYKQMNLLSNTFFYRDTNVLINDLKNHLYYDNNIFIKGSNSINLQKVVNHLIKPIEN